MSNGIYRIAVDGPSGAGKSTIAKRIAKELNIEYIDTGAMYRAIGYKVAACASGPWADTEAASTAPIDEAAVDELLAGDGLKALLDETQIDFVDGHIILDGRDVGDKIRTPEMSMMASKCSAIPAVREKLVEIQRQMGRRKSVIMDGRDIGTNVLKDAEYKIYLTASAEERAERRYKELVEKGESQTYEEVLKDIIQRDHNDMTRKLNPLRKADDAVEIDTTGMNIEEVVAECLKLID
jgi:cytidylate kinase